MRGEFIGVWSETWREIWLPLIDHEDVPEDIFCELYRELAPALKSEAVGRSPGGHHRQPRAEPRGVREDERERLRRRACARGVSRSGSLRRSTSWPATSFPIATSTCSTAFIDKFSLRYDLRRPCTLCPTLPGVFASLVRDLRVLTSRDAHLDALMKEFENAVRDLRHDCSDGRIKTCIQKQVNLLEAIGRTVPGVTGTTLGAICNQVGTWPHEKLKEAMK